MYVMSVLTQTITGRQALTILRRHTLEGDAYQVLVDVHGYDYAEAAELLELPLGTVKSRLSRARSALRMSMVQAGLVPKHLANLQLQLQTD